MPQPPVHTEFIEANGLRFEVLTCGTGPRLALCLHGFPEVADSWRQQMPALAPLGYRVWAPNQRGYGKTSRPPHVSDYAIEHLMADVAALIDASGAPEVVLIAHDWGALVAWTFATRRIRPLRALAILNVPHPVCFARELRRNPGQMLRSWYMLFFQIPWLPEWLLSRRGGAPVRQMMLRSSTSPATFPRDLLDLCAANAAQPGAARAMIHWYRAFLRGGFRRQLRLGFPPITVPVLLIWGMADVALSYATTHGTEEFAPNLTRVDLAGVSHWVQQDATAACNSALAQFLADPEPAT
ncbi:alpha/beta fold hydrolase [Terriglobus aquaticus]|uniref:Alpha/beta fold hydrolase n=1 Tax=Terriglobus aquaticus TaxID=940139 RepID=A0ABW9KH77_9BACT|nr:alpha/beta hydrolase [Terriglobus aquaticus]